MAEKEQLDALASLDELLAREAIEYWVFGGWAVDFHAGEITRPHDDLDIAVSAAEHERAGRLLAAAGWTGVEEGPGYVAYARDGVRVEVASTDEDEWPDDAFGEDVRKLEGVRARVISLRALNADKSQDRDDAAVAEKDRADVAILSRLGPEEAESVGTMGVPGRAKRGASGSLNPQSARAGPNPFPRGLLFEVGLAHASIDGQVPRIGSL